MNFLEFFYLKENPFGETPDPRFYFAARPHEHAFRQLSWALEFHKGFILVSGEAGSGKTTLSRVLYESYRGEAGFAFILNPSVSCAELFNSICREFGVSDSSPDNLNQALLERASRGQRNVLVIDEAQVMSDAGLEFVRLLTNLETNNRKLLQVILFAQPELAQRLEGAQFRQLRQRIVLELALTFLDETSTADYIRHRVERAGGCSFVRFDAQAIKRIHRITRGAPRLINKVCELALRCATLERTRLIDSRLLARLPLESVGVRTRRGIVSLLMQGKLR